ncbi:MAG: MAPEG family protein [Methylobacteriaceae bacterium]|nr:MAPEG family protein [Rhodoblastus sp.]MCC0003719.1 MAPEG family protein [Methylobacteriaceae bacterium]
MSVQAVLLPVFALVALLFFLLGRMALTRVGSIKAGETKLKEVALGQDAWPAPIQQTSNAYANNLQLPILFYALVAFAMLTKKDDLIFVIMSWLFVASRYAHAFVHVTSNHVPTRFNMFALGVFILGLMWTIFAVRVLLSI